MWHRIEQLPIALLLSKKKKEEVREWGKEGRTETVGLVGRSRVQRERERKNTSATAVHALPARNGVSVIYGGHSRLELSLSENMFTPGDWNIRSGFGPTTTGRLHFSTFCLPERTSLFRFCGAERGRGRGIERLRLVPVLIPFPYTRDATYASCPFLSSWSASLPLAKKKFFFYCSIARVLKLITSINNSKILGTKILLSLEKWNFGR